MEPISPQKWQEMYPGITNEDIQKYKELEQMYFMGEVAFITFRDYLEKTYKQSIQK